MHGATANEQMKLTQLRDEMRGLMSGDISDKREELLDLKKRAAKWADANQQRRGMRKAWLRTIKGMHSDLAAK